MMLAGIPVSEDDVRGLIATDTDASVVRVRDVVVVPWVLDEATLEEFEAHPPAENSALVQQPRLSQCW